MYPCIRGHDEVTLRSVDFTLSYTWIYCYCWVAKLSDSFAAPWTIAHQAPLSMGFFRQEYWSGLPFPPPGDLPSQGSNPLNLLHCRWILDCWATWEDHTWIMKEKCRSGNGSGLGKEGQRREEKKRKKPEGDRMCPAAILKGFLEPSYCCLWGKHCTNPDLCCFHVWRRAWRWYPQPLPWGPACNSVECLPGPSSQRVPVLVGEARLKWGERLSTKELILLSCGVGEDSWESVGLQGDPTSPS